MQSRPGVRAHIRDANPAADLAGCQQRATWLRRDELVALVGELCG